MTNPPNRKIGEPAEILEFIEQFRTEHGYPPSVRDIAGRWGMSAAAAHTTLQRLVADGLISTAPGIPRSINITGAGMKMMTERL
jgi:repressor LexA